MISLCKGCPVAFYSGDVMQKDGPVRKPGPTLLLPAEHPVGPGPLTRPFPRERQPGKQEGTEPLPYRASPPQNARPDTPLEIPLLKTQSVYDRMTLFNRMD